MKKMPQLRIGILSMSAIADDPRVRRQGEAFFEAGWSVVAFGLDGGKSPAPLFRIVTPSMLAASADPLPPPLPDSQIAASAELPVDNRASTKLGRIFGFTRVFSWIYWRIANVVLKKLLSLVQLIHGAFRRAAHDIHWPHFRAARQQLFRQFMSSSYGLKLEYNYRLAQVRFRPYDAERVFWSLNGAFFDLYRLASKENVDIWLANDWSTLPIARRLAAQKGVTYAYDTHELAVEEFSESIKWRIVDRPLRYYLEKQMIVGCAVVSTVSNGIASRLKEIYKLTETPLVVRSIPRYANMAFRPTGPVINVLYHGAIWEGRGLEACIQSVSLWRPEFRFTIRGPVSGKYRQRLEEEIRAAGVSDRVSIVPPVPLTALVEEASAFDVGLFALPGHSRHNQYALPNKFFEYTMAGLALCVSDLAEMGSLMRKYQLGVVIPRVTSEHIATAINSLNPEAIDRFKRNSLAAAQELNWEQEREKLVLSFERALHSQISRDTKLTA